METRVCKSCGKELPLTNDYFQICRRPNKDYYRWICKPCYNASRPKKGKPLPIADEVLSTQVKHFMGWYVAHAPADGEVDLSTMRKVFQVWRNRWEEYGDKSM